MKAMMRVLRACLSEHAIEATEVEKLISKVAEFCRKIGGTVELSKEKKWTGVSCILPSAKPLDFIYNLEGLRIRSEYDEEEEEFFIDTKEIHIDAKTQMMSSSVWWVRDSDFNAHVYGNFKEFEVGVDKDGDLHIHIVGLKPESR